MNTQIVTGETCGVSRAVRWTLLAVLIAVSLILRVAGYDFGLPDTYHYDEIRSVAQVGAWLDGEYKLETYRHPPLLREIAWCGLNVYRLIAQIDIDDREELIYRALRLVSVTAGTLAVLAVYLLAGQFVPFRWAYAAAVLFAVQPMTVFCSKYGVPDMLMSCLFIFGLALQMILTRRRSTVMYFLAGLIIACAVGAKYNAVFLYLSFITAHIYGSRDAGGGRSYFAPVLLGSFMAGSLIGYVISFPLVFFRAEFPYLIESLLFEKRHLFVQGHYSLKISGPDFFYVYHFIRSVLPSTGIILWAAVIAGLIFGLLRRQRYDSIAATCWIPYYIVMEHVYKIPPAPQRYVLPLMGIYIVYAVLICARTADWATHRLRLRQTVAVLVAVLMLGSYPAYKTVRLVMTIVPDTRQIMQAWMRENVPAGSTILAHGYSFGFHGSIDETFNVIPNIHELRNDEQTARQLDYMLASSLMYGVYLNHPSENPAMTGSYRKLLKSGTSIHTVKPEYESYMYHNPTLTLYDTRPGIRKGR